jgi:hypothetical protein
MRFYYKTKNLDFYKDFNEMVCMTELGFQKCENIASYHQKDMLLRVNYFLKKCAVKPNQEEYVKMLLI